MAIDYSRIASSYDNAPFRDVDSFDVVIDSIVNKKPCTTAQVLDLGCGTGSYIHVNKTHFKDKVRIYGFDKSTSMLERALTKNIDMLILGDACQGLPLRNLSMDYISCRYAFHHFEDKNCVISEIGRCLRRGGIFRFLDVEPHSNTKWWVYDLFPEILYEDKQRFILPGLLKTKFEMLGFNVSYKIHTGAEIMSKDALIQRLTDRDTSQLHMVSERTFYERLKEVQSWPSEKKIIGDFAFLNFMAEKME
jgi:ubiquinone/menaquinone biosynthesis C-methylase UbiE